MSFMIVFFDTRRGYLMKMKCLCFMVMFLVAGSFLVGCNVETATKPIYKTDVVYTADAPYVPW